MTAVQALKAEVLQNAVVNAEYVRLRGQYPHPDDDDDCLFAACVAALDRIGASREMIATLKDWNKNPPRRRVC